jgi:hypothetical protein
MGGRASHSRTARLRAVRSVCWQITKGTSANSIFLTEQSTVDLQPQSSAHRARESLNELGRTQRPPGRQDARS